MLKFKQTNLILYLQDLALNFNNNSMQNSSFIMNKAVDWSLLSYGFNIPVSLQTLFYKIYGAELLKGDQKKIKVIINGEEFEADRKSVV